MSEKPYTPSTDEVRAGWITGETRDGLGVDHDDLQPGVAAEFDRWLTGVKAQAWDEGYKDCFLSIDGSGWRELEDNPYRQEATR